VQDGEQPFRGEEAISDDADEKRGDERGDGRSPVGEPNLAISEPKRLSEVRPHSHKPGAPDEVLEEHHDGQAGFNCHGRGWQMAEGRWRISCANLDHAELIGKIF